MLRAKTDRWYSRDASNLAALALLCVTAALCAPALAQEGEVRPSALAGSWYPEDPDELRRRVDDFLAAVNAPDLYGELRALIAPHAGYRFSGYAAAAAFKCIGDQEFARVVILAPTHNVPLRGCSVPAYSAYRTPLGDVPLDAAACAALRRHSLISDQRRAHRSEHSIEIELPFLQRTLEQFSIVPVLVGHLEEDEVEELAAALRPLLDESTLLVASSDFTHYGARFGYQPFASDVENQLRNLDFGAFSAILSGEAGQLLDYKRRTGITACGALPIAVLLAAVGDRTQSMLLSYYNSAQITGDSSESVSYGAFCFARARTLINELEQATLMRLSRDVLNSCTAGGSLPLVSFDNYNVTPAMMRNAGVFVTLRHGERLRGCSGSIGGVRGPALRACDGRGGRRAADRNIDSHAARAAPRPRANPTRSRRPRAPEGRQVRPLPAPGGHRAGLQPRAVPQPALPQSRPAARRPRRTGRRAPPLPGTEVRRGRGGGGGGGLTLRPYAGQSLWAEENG